MRYVVQLLLEMLYMIGKMMYKTMQRYSIKYTRDNLATLLKQLPFAITRYGVIVAKVQGFTTDSVVHDTSRDKTPVVQQNDVQQLDKIKIVTKEGIKPAGDNGICKHGYLRNLCKHAECHTQ